MLPVGVLMVEHRVIERMIKLWENELNRINATGKANSSFLGQAVDFMRTYADHFHHGKEENMLFALLRQKPLTGGLASMLDGLAEEHTVSRRTVAALAAANRDYAAGAEDALAAIRESISAIIRLYPAHIRKEDKQFFLPVMEFLTDMEKEKMLADFRAFEPSTHDTYKSMVFVMEQK
ncbi:MAG: hemerythrin domain-containing protein [Candidatus Omnitrophica bacterium]|nr:hemerythrin domain-containing protein [Candidatus Omnitrophota bacterium]